MYIHKLKKYIYIYIHINMYVCNMYISYLSVLLAAVARVCGQHVRSPSNSRKLLQSTFPIYIGT